MGTGEPGRGATNPTTHGTSVATVRTASRKNLSHLRLAALVASTPTADRTAQERGILGASHQCHCPWEARRWEKSPLGCRGLRAHLSWVFRLVDAQQSADPTLTGRQA